MNPRSHRFRFSLRTMFVALTALAMLAAVAGYHVNWIAERRAAAENWGSFCNPISGNGVQAPLLLRWMGEPGYAALVRSPLARDEHNPSAEEQAEIARLQKLFPEAELVTIVTYPSP